MLILTPVILLTLWSMVMVPEKQEIPLSHQETAQGQVETYITRGKELIDKAMIPAKSYADTVKEKNYGTFMQFLDLTDTITHIRNNFCQSIYQKEGAHFGQQIETALSKYQMDFLIQASKDFGINKE